MDWYHVYAYPGHLCTLPEILPGLSIYLYAYHVYLSILVLPVYGKYNGNLVDYCKLSADKPYLLTPLLTALLTP